jgi:hypothetical protein
VFLINSRTYCFLTIELIFMTENNKARGGAPPKGVGGPQNFLRLLEAKDTYVFRLFFGLVNSRIWVKTQVVPLPFQIADTRRFRLR